MKIAFNDQFYNTSNGWSVLSGTKQIWETNACKEVFARRLLDDAAGTSKVVVRFLRKETGTKITPELAARQEKVLHAFEKALDISPLAKVEIVTHNRKWYTYDYSGWPTTKIQQSEDEVYLLYTISKQWRKNLPLGHILALITRNYYPEGKRMDWRSVLVWLNKKKTIGIAVKKTANEIIRDKGKVDLDIKNNGISDYTGNLAKARAIKHV